MCGLSIIQCDQHCRTFTQKLNNSNYYRLRYPVSYFVIVETIGSLQYYNLDKQQYIKTYT